MAKRYWDCTPEQVVAANQEILSRIKELGIDLHYDYVLDTVFVEIGGPRAATNVCVDDDIMLRVARDTFEVVGAEIPLYLAGVARERPDLARSLQQLGIRKHRDPDYRMPPDKAVKTGQLLQWWIGEFCRAEAARPQPAEPFGELR